MAWLGGRSVAHYSCINRDTRLDIVSPSNPHHHLIVVYCVWHCRVEVLYRCCCRCGCKSAAVIANGKSDTVKRIEGATKMIRGYSAIPMPLLIVQ